MVPPEEKKEEAAKPAEEPKKADKPGELTVDAVKKLDAATDDIQYALNNLDQRRRRVKRRNHK